MSHDAIDAFIERLASSPAGPNSTNFFDDTRPDNAIRRRNLRRYLGQLANRRPTTLLVGEAPGYRGMAITGVPFTNTTLLRRGIPHFDLFGTANGYEIPDASGIAAEPTATVGLRPTVAVGSSGRRSRQRVHHGLERGLDLGAEDGDHTDDDRGDQGDEQAVLHRGGALLLTLGVEHDLQQELSHAITLR